MKCEGFNVGTELGEYTAATLSTLILTLGNTKRFIQVFLRCKQFSPLSAISLPGLAAVHEIPEAHGSTGKDCKLDVFKTTIKGNE